MDKNFTANLVLMMISCIVCFMILELVVRYGIGRYDENGQFTIKSREIKPFVHLDFSDYKSAARPYLRYDSYLGWTININASPDNFPYRSNSAGIRSDRDYSLKKPAGTLRIALFGDSFMHSDDVPNNGTIGYHLEKILTKKGINAEVLNFGVSGYGNDQAYLRWKLEGRQYNPDIVIIGFLPIDCMRNLNIVPAIMNRGSGLKHYPIMKPRFILDQGKLVLVNYPIPPEDQISELIRDFDNSKRKEFEYFYDPSDYSKANPLYWSKLVAGSFTAVEHILGNIEPGILRKKYYEGDTEKLCLAIFQKFVNESSQDSDVFILHFPLMHDLVRKDKELRYIYQDMYDQLNDSYDFISPTKNLLAYSHENSMDSLFNQHYFSIGNRIVAESIYDYIENKLQLKNQSID